MSRNLHGWMDIVSTTAATTTTTCKSNHWRREIAVGGGQAGRHRQEQQYRTVRPCRVLAGTRYLVPFALPAYIHLHVYICKVNMHSAFCIYIEYTVHVL